MVGVNGQTTASLMASGQAVPPPQLIRALVDTGTDVTGVVSGVLSRLGLGPIRLHSTQTLTGTVAVQLFEISLTIPQTTRVGPPLLVFDQLIVMGLPAPLTGIDALLGLDVLDHLMLIVDGPRGEVTICD